MLPLTLLSSQLILGIMNTSNSTSIMPELSTIDSDGTKAAELKCVVPVGKTERKTTPLLEKSMLTMLNLDLLQLLTKELMMNLWVSKT